MIHWERQFGIPYQVGNDLGKGVVRWLGGQSRFILENPVLGIVGKTIVFLGVLPGVGAAAVNAGRFVIGPRSAKSVR